MIINFNNFKSFPLLSKDQKHHLNFSRINLIYGLNNSGKSSILQFLSLIAKNYENLFLIKTNYEDLPLGSFNNIMNYSKNNKNIFEFSLFEDSIRKFDLSNYNKNDLPKSGLHFNYKNNENLDSAATGIIRDFRIQFDYSHIDSKKITTFNFVNKNEKTPNIISCEKIEISNSCIFFNFNDLALSLKELKPAILKKTRELKKEYDQTILQLSKFNNQINELDELLFSKQNKLNKKLFDNSLSYILNDLSNPVLTFFKSFEPYLLNENLEINHKNKYNVKRGNIFKADSRRLALIQQLSEETIIEKISLINKSLVALTKLLKAMISSDSVDHIKTSIEKEKNFKSDQIFLWQGAYNFFKDNKLIDFENFNKTKSNKKVASLIKYFEKITSLLKIIAEFKISFYIDQFYRVLGNMPKDLKVINFFYIDKKDIENLILYSKNDAPYEDSKFLKDIFISCLQDKISIHKNISEFSEINGLENNLLQILNLNSLNSNSPIINLDNLRNLLHRFTTLSPFHNLIKIKNNNCDLSERIHQIKNFEDANVNRYDQTHIVNEIYKDKNLLNLINDRLSNIGFDVKLGFKDNLIENNEIIAPILLNPKSLTLKGYLADAGQAIRKLIPTIYHLSKHSDAVITMEEPEANIHPQYQANLADLIVDSFNSHNNEFVIETHSELLILRFLKLIRQNLLNVKDFSIHYVDQMKNGSQITRIVVNEDGSLNTHWPGGFFKERLEEF